MYSLDVLDYLTDLEDHLEGRLDRPERKMARTEMRRLIEDLAFRFAFMDGRVMPEEMDYVRALECLKRPERVADVLVAKRSVYTRRKVRARVTKIAVLAVLLVVGAAFAAFAASEEGAVVLDEEYNVGNAESKNFVTRVDTFTFNVTDETTRLLLTSDVLITDGNITLTLVSPSGEQAFVHTFRSGQGSVYERKEILDPEAGEWVVDVKYEDAVAIVDLWAQIAWPAR